MSRDFSITEPSLKLDTFLTMVYVGIQGIYFEALPSEHIEFLVDLSRPTFS